MFIIRPNKTRIKTSGITLVAIIALMLIATGCMKNYGQFSMNAQVDQAFRTGERQPEYRYYYSGRDTMPYAIIGIDHSYTVPSRYWIPFAPEPEQLKKMSANIYREVHYQPYGAYILDPDGKAVGVWYSNVFNRSVKVDQEKRTVQVLFTNPENDSHLR